MNKCLPFVVLLLLSVSSWGQIFEEELVIPAGYTPDEVLMPPSPLWMQVLFVGGHDIVQTTPTYGNPQGRAIAKEWHDFIGFTKDTDSEELGWVSVNHELIYHDDHIGDGGGMTVFKVKRSGDSLELVHQSLDDGREGYFFNVDFANTVGETGMNCGGISSIVDGRIWTAEEWFRSSNNSIYEGGFSGVTSNGSAPHAPGTSENQGVRDTVDYTISSDIAEFDGMTIPKYENFNWMVEVDPRQAVALRKQYNWGRAGFEGGIVMTDNQTVYLGVDATPAPWMRFRADSPGDFTQGTLEVWKHDNAEGERWIEITMTADNMLNLSDKAWEAGATMFNRNEWVAVDSVSNIVYWTETGRDNPAGRWADELADGGVFAPHHMERAADQGVSGPDDEAYWDYYGRVLYYDPATETQGVLIEGGPYFDASPSEADYPSKHLSNPDGLNVIQIDGQSYLLIMEDLNGTSFGRTPADISNRLCEMYILDLSIAEPTIDDLIRISAIPAGAEITGGIMTSDGASLLVNSQHPNVDNPFPYNHSLTFAIHGFDELTTTSLRQPDFGDEEGIQVFPNPTSRTLHLSENSDFAIYNMQGQRINVFRNVNEADVSHLTPGQYFIRTEDQQTLKFIVQ